MARQSIIPFTSSQYFIGNTRNQYITPATPTVLSFTSSDGFTVGARVKLFKKQAAGNNDAMTIASMDFSFGANLGYIAQVGNGFTFWSGSTSYNSTVYPIVYGKWHTVVFRVSGTTLTGFVDGVLVWTQTIARVGATAGNAYFGDEGPGTGATARRIMGFANDFFSVRSALTDQQIADLSLRGSWPTVDVRYPLNDGSGSTAADFSGNGNNGTITGSTWDTNNLFGKTRVAASNRRVIQDMKASLDFGTGGATTNVLSFAMGSSFSAANLTDMTVATWVNLRSAGGSGAGRVIDGTPFLINCAGVPSGYQLNCQVIHATTPAATSTDRLKYNTWYRVLFTFSDSGTVVNTYTDGITSTQTQTTKSGARSSTAGTAYVGNRSDLVRGLNGKLSRFRIWDRVLTASEIAADAANLRVSSGLLVDDFMEEGAGLVAYDSSGNGNNGTITGASFTSDVPSRKRGVVGGNLVRNGDFEYAPPFTAATNTVAWIDGTASGSASNMLFGWKLSGFGVSGSARFDPANAHSGNYAMKVSTLSANNSIDVSLRQTLADLLANGIPVLPNTSYTFSAYAKSVLNSGAATTGARIQVVQKDASNNTVGSTVTYPIGAATTPWTQYTSSFTTAATCRYIIIFLTVKGNDGAATAIMDAWFDDITLVKN